MGSYRTYITGFGLSLVLTLLAFYVVWQYTSSHHPPFPLGLLIAIITILATTQLIAQLVFFLHLGRGSKPKWNMVVFLFMLMVVIIVVVGSLWIMQNLDYHHPVPASKIDDYIIHDEGIR